MVEGGGAFWIKGFRPEFTRLAAVAGAGIICNSTDWVPILGQREGEKPMAVTLWMFCCDSGSVSYGAAANRGRVVRGQHGSSRKQE